MLRTGEGICTSTTALRAELDRLEFHCVIYRPTLLVYHVHVCILVIAVDDNTQPYDIDEQPPFTGDQTPVREKECVLIISRLTVQK